LTEKKEMKKDTVNRKTNPSHFVPRKNVDGIKKTRKRKDNYQDELNNDEVLEIREKLSLTSLNIKNYKDELIGNEHILEGDVISEVVFNSYLKYLDNEYNTEKEAPARTK
jgi:hypothetical protein